jgi:hypothetical protein
MDRGLVVGELTVGNPEASYTNGGLSRGHLGGGIDFILGYHLQWQCNVSSCKRVSGVEFCGFEEV